MAHDPDPLDILRKGLEEQRSRHDKLVKAVSDQSEEMMRMSRELVEERHARATLEKHVKRDAARRDENDRKVLAELSKISESQAKAEQAFVKAATSRRTWTVFGSAVGSGLVMGLVFGLQKMGWL